ncbi:aminotransferase class I/II-fold pyridoxal phosphate-dependent enzyme [Phenylobacterium sp.]|uniref:aminotransferase class I/II-fold pyridoxal phosphate-dependent enzyme n=1 Tax=Phenylobacterium sp. TaxID=1871053 RepID=UPI003BAB64FF
MKALAARLRDEPRVRKAMLARRIGRYPYFEPVGSASLPELEVGGETLLNFGSNNYLGLAADRRTIAAGQTALRDFGSGTTGSRLLNGTLRLHEALEARLATFYDMDAALVFPTGYAANLGLISGVFERGDLIVADRDAHASLLDGIALSGAEFRRFPHNRTAAAGRLLAQALKGRATGLVVEGIYSMCGDAAPLGALADLAEGRGAFLIVDEAHGLGTVGARGRGGAELAGALGRVDAVTVTFSKSLGSCGGAVIGSRDLIEALRARSRPFIFTASNTPASIASALAALDILIDAPELVDELQGRANALRLALEAHAVRARRSDGPIITVPTGGDFETLQAWRMLRNRGVFCNPVMTPAVPEGQGLIRLSVMRTHTDEHIAAVAAAFGEIAPWLAGEVRNQSLEAAIPGAAGATVRAEEPQRLSADVGRSGAP